MTVEAVGLHVELGGREVLRGVSVRLETASMTAVVGPNGSGKSTLVRTLAGVLRPSAGEVRIADEPVRAIPRRSLARKLGLLTQNAEAPALLTVRDHVALGRHAHRTLFRGDAHADAVAVDRAMQRCEIEYLADRRVAELSGGERQRARLATLLAQDPRALLLDEPLTGLDIEHQLSLLHLLVDLNREGRTIVCVLHDLDLALRFFPRALVMHVGRLVADGPPAEILCPRIFETVFRVEGGLSRDSGGRPIVVCTRPLCPPGGCAADGVGERAPLRVNISDTIASKEIRPMAHPHTPASDAAAPAADGFAFMLRTGTQDLHDIAEAGPFQKRMVEGELSREEYAAFLQQVRHVHAAFEPLLRAAAATEPRVAQLLCEDHYRLAKIDRDLADLGADRDSAPLEATRRFTGFIADAATKDPVSLVGVLYVKEGATNGNKVVAKRIRESLGLGAGVAMGYLDPHGAEQRRRWTAFKESLDTLPLSGDEKSRCLDAARATFRLFMDLSAELEARRPAVAG